MSFIKNHSFIALSGLILVLIGVGIAGRVNRIKTTAPADTASTNTRVTLFPLSTFRTDSTTVQADGKVESLGQADLRSQLSAPVAQILVSVGQRVTEGQTLVQLKNDDIRAQLAGARAQLAAQEALFAQTKTGTRPESISIKESDVARVANDLDNLYRSALTTLSDAYAKADDAMRARISDLYTNPYSTTPELTFVTSDPQAKIDLISQRIEANNHMAAWKSELDSLSTTAPRTNIDTALASAEQHLGAVSTLLTTALRAIDNAPALPAATLAGFKANVAVARSSVSGVTAAITGMRSGLSSSRLVLDRSTQELNLLKAGSTNDQLDVGRAQVEAARATVSNIESLLAKTIVRSPIDGTVASLPARVGELQSPGQIIASIVSSGALQVKAYTSAAEATLIEEGVPALINGSTKGTVARIAPSIDAATKKVEVDIAVTARTPSLFIGDTANVSITTKHAATKIGTYLLPIQAVKVSPAGSFILTVDGQSKIKEVPVRIAVVRGEFVEISDDLSSTTSIVSPVYELRVGQTVTAK